MYNTKIVDLLSTKSHVLDIPTLLEGVFDQSIRLHGVHWQGNIIIILLYDGDWFCFFSSNLTFGGLCYMVSLSHSLDQGPKNSAFLISCVMTEQFGDIFMPTGVCNHVLLASLVSFVGLWLSWLVWGTVLRVYCYIHLLCWWALYIICHDLKYQSNTAFWWSPEITRSSHYSHARIRICPWHYVIDPVPLSRPDH